MPKMLFLDDSENRHNSFKRQVAEGPEGWEITHVYTAQEAIQKIAENSFDLISLDHDLGGEESHMTLPEQGGGSGYDVACFINSLPDGARPKAVIVHSLNPSGAERMLKAMNKVERTTRIPFRH